MNILPCPFCGDEYPEVRRKQIDEKGWKRFAYYVFCCCCEAEGPMVHPVMGGEAAIEQWNSRPREGLPSSVIEALNSGDGTYRP